MAARAAPRAPLRAANQPELDLIPAQWSRREAAQLRGEVTDDSAGAHSASMKTSA
jgi:hypothetical protein